jgi:malonate-semialdehyde dehydrogenase (acetylating)/methylmalonate-semialdehyde dehydrogenase
MNNSGRKTASIKINCPFHIKGSVPTSKKVIDKFWTMEVLNGSHNHDPSDGASSHAAHKQLIPSQYEDIRKLLQANLKPDQILLQLRKSDNKTYTTNKTISNALQKICCNNLAG